VSEVSEVVNFTCKPQNRNLKYLLREFTNFTNFTNESFVKKLIERSFA
jgi:hypothetical protein